MNLNFSSVLVTIITLVALVAPASSQPSEGTTVTLGNVLTGYLHEGKVDYEGIRARRRPELQRYVKSLEDAKLEKMPKAQQISFWLDAYNALVVHQIVETGRAPTTARDRSKFFRGTRYLVAGQRLTLDQIEHQALRPLASDPRVHFLLVCGANSCPPLQASAFLDSEETLETRLERATSDFVRDPAQVQIDVERRELRLSSLFDWYKEDFGNVPEFLARYLEPAQAEMVSKGSWTIKYLDYDWSLNNVAE